MNVDRQIVAKSQQKFHTLPSSTHEVPGPTFTKFLYDVGKLSLLLMRAFA